MIITEKSYTDALDRVVNIIEARKPSLDVNNIVIVPDVYTFALEKRLFSRGKGAFDVEVTTFNRLYTRLNAGGERVALSKQGALMLLKKVCREHADELGCYSRSCLRTGFAVKLYDALNTLRACAVSPSDLEAAEDMRKSRDLAVLYREYLREIDGRYVNAAGRNRLLGEIIEKTDAFRGANVYVTLYDKLSAEVKRLLGIIERSARSLTIVEAAPAFPSTKRRRNASRATFTTAAGTTTWRLSTRAASTTRRNGFSTNSKYRTIRARSFRLPAPSLQGSCSARSNA